MVWALSDGQEMSGSRRRGRTRLVEQKTETALRKRGAELIGAILLLAGGAIWAMLWTYSPDDPSVFSATDAPPQNALGLLGASLADPLYRAVGWAGYVIPLTLFVWGVRLLLHRGEDQVVSRMILTPIAVAATAVFASAHIPYASWSHAYGLGGMVGDSVLGTLVSFVPLPLESSMLFLTLLLAMGAATTTLIAGGMTRTEGRSALNFIWEGLIISFDAFLRGVSLLGRSAISGAKKASAQRQKRREAAIETTNNAKVTAAERDRAETKIVRAEAATEQMPADASTVVLGPANAAGKKVEQTHNPANSIPDEDRVMARISDVVKARKPVPRVKNRDLGSRTTPPRDFDRRTVPPRELGPATELSARDVGAATVPPRELGTASPSQHGMGGRTVPPRELGSATMPPHDIGGRTMPPRELGSATLPPIDFDSRTIPPGGLKARTDEIDATPMPKLGGVIRDEAAAAARRVAAARAAAKQQRVEPRVQHPERKPAPKSVQAKREEQPSLRLEETPAQAYEPPALSLLQNMVPEARAQLADDALEENARMLETVLDDYGIKGEIIAVRPGPVVTMYELEPAAGIKASRVIGLADDIARSMSALAARVSTIPGRSVIGIELPNDHREKVLLREILSARDYGDSKHSLPLALGKDIGGEPVVANLARMPHLLIAGTTGSGKSVAINTMILSLLYKLTPDECRMIMIDPKMLELSVYDGIPHLLSPVVTDPKKAVVALKWVVAEMEERYRKMSKMGVRNIDGYNGRVKEAMAKGEAFKRTVQTGFDDATGEPIFETEEYAPETMPFIVVIVDEMADLMMVAGKEIEACIQRLAQMARASGIHLIMATQRPSVDVITGTIKANFPTRISFQVTSKVDSRTILGEMGAEQLLGMGDMLHMAGGGKITRVHGPFVSDEEVEEVVSHLKLQGTPEYVSGVVDGPESEKESEIDLVLGLGGNTNGEDALYDQAVAIVARDRKCSTSYIQRKLAIGYNKAARLVEQMEDQGVVSAANSVGKREVLVPEA